MKKGGSNQDQLSAYYFARLCDLELSKMFDENPGKVDFDKIQNCCRIAELNFSQVNIGKFVEELEKQEWSLDYIYLDRRKNLYDFKLEQVQEVEVPQSSD